MLLTLLGVKWVMTKGSWENMEAWRRVKGRGTGKDVWISCGGACGGKGMEDFLKGRNPFSPTFFV